MSAALNQLLEMGIPGGRARAALKRAKGDAMAAAERVFAGEFDNVASDDEGDEGDADGDARRPVASGSSSVKPTGRADVVMRGARDEGDEGEDEEANLDMEDGDSDGFDGFDDTDDDNVLDMDMDEIRVRSDPYAGVFFSKDRVETIIETVDAEESFIVPTSEGSTAFAQGQGKIEVKVLGSGEWMSGCPEGNEQSFLFQLYNKQSSEDVACPSGCGHVFKRTKKDFFVIFPDFKSYLAHLAAHIRPVCPQCQTIICLACGESCSSAVQTPIFKPLPKLPKVQKPTEQEQKQKDVAGKSSKSTSKKTGTITSSNWFEEETATPSPAANVNNQKPLGRIDVEVDELLHCVDLQGIIIGVGLHIIEQAFDNRLARAQTSPSPGGPAQRKRQRTLHPSISGAKVTQGGASSVSGLPTPDPEDEGANVQTPWGYIRGSGPKGTGYAGNVTEDRSGQIKAQGLQQERDAMTATLLRQVQNYLPQISRSGGSRTSDLLVHPTALAHLRRRSGFVNSLLRNDSLLDMSGRSELYKALFDWLEIISSHEALASMLAMPQMRPAHTKPVVSSSPDNKNTNDTSYQVEVTYEGAHSPRELLENVVIQAQAALRGLQTVKEESAFEGMTDEEKRQLTVHEAQKREREQAAKKLDDANETLKVFCQRILDSAKTIDRSLVETKGEEFVKRMQEALPRLPDSSKPVEEVGRVSTASAEAVIKIYEEWAGKTRFQYADLTDPANRQNYKHAYASNINGISNMSAPKRSLAIAKELAILTTNLPVAWHSTIFLRVDEARVDCIKAMIIGPEGTPYENGCFLFDIFLPLEYNVTNPLVKTMTTNGGTYRYNPNLYADGKVCLSLLGTWQGPGWVSGQSTLLQVLISIQSLILCEEPYCNEPGWATGSGSAASKAYSANVRRMVVHDAMGNNLKNLPHPWSNEIKTHFRLKANSIREQLDKWEEMDDRVGTSSETVGGFSAGGRSASSGGSFKSRADALRKMLDKLESEGVEEGEGEGEKDGEMVETSGLGGSQVTLVDENVGQGDGKGKKGK